MLFRFFLKDYRDGEIRTATGRVPDLSCLKVEGSDSSRFRLGIFKSVSLLDRRAEDVGWYDVVLKGVDGENSRGT